MVQKDYLCLPCSAGNVTAHVQRKLCIFQDFIHLQIVHAVTAPVDFVMNGQMIHIWPVRFFELDLVFREVSYIVLCRSEGNGGSDWVLLDYGVGSVRGQVNGRSDLLAEETSCNENYVGVRDLKSAEGKNKNSMFRLWIKRARQTSMKCRFPNSQDRTGFYPKEKSLCLLRAIRYQHLSHHTRQTS